jgi:hypothetical protein
MTKTPVPQAEFSRPIAADQIGPQEIEREIVANAAERARLVERFGLLALDRLSATVELKRGRGGLIQVRGRFEAEVVQACVVTLDPVRSKVAESFSVAFATGSIAAAAVVIGLDEEDPPGGTDRGPDRSRRDRGAATGGGARPLSARAGCRREARGLGSGGSGHGEDRESICGARAAASASRLTIPASGLPLAGILASNRRFTALFSERL